MKRPCSVASPGAAPNRWRRRDGGPHAEAGHERQHHVAQLVEAAVKEVARAVQGNLQLGSR